MPFLRSPARLMNIPVCYHVSPVCGGWEARFDHNATSSRFWTRDLAIEAARDAAEAHWRMSGLGTCVVVEDAAGKVVEDLSFGAVPPTSTLL
jgi:hypothetical protein